MDFSEAMQRLRTAQGETSESAAKLRTAMLGLASVPGVKPGTCIRHPHPVQPEFFEGSSPRPCPACGCQVPEGWDVVNEEAAQLARETPFTYADWLTALTRIRDRPEKDKLIMVIRDIAVMNGWKPDWAAIALAGDGIRPGLLDWKAEAQ